LLEGEKEARIRWRWDRRRQQADQAASTADQTTADRDQTASDTDQSASDRDQVQADADQRASERDQAASDRDFARRPIGDAEMVRTHELSRTERVQGTLDRHAATLARSQVSSERDEQANQRDEVAQQRDRVAEERDRVAEEHDREMKRAGEDLGGDDPRAARAMAALAEMRDRAAAQRMQAATDRTRAARDRKAAAADREHLLAELERAHLDDLTGAYRRGMGETTLVNEIERSRRADQALVLAYIDCDRLKDVNDREGHAAGDALLRDLVALLRSKLRPYDPVVRWGGDEFVCTISDADLAAARSRFEEIRLALAQDGGAPVTVGLAVLEAGDTLETLIERADAALLEARRRR
jgi:diguanylate cyclase (GGDEF)-like protein